MQRVGAAVMVNILGSPTESMDDTKALLKRGLGISGVGVHWYGKSETRKGRKMAHLTVVGDDIYQVKDRLELLGLDPSAYGLRSRGSRVGIIMGSDSDLPTMKDAAQVRPALN